MTMIKETTEVVEKKEQTLEESIESAEKIAKMKHKALSTLLGQYLDFFSSQMMATNGVSYAKKLETSKALKEAVLFSLDFGLDISEAKIRQGGQYLTKEVNALAGIMTQALDNRMLLVATNLNKKEQETKLEGEKENVENEQETE